MTPTISHPETKIAVITVLLVVILLSGLLLATTVSGAAAGASALVMTVAMVWFCTRAFRGPTEDSRTPRAWWRMTERSFSGYLMASLFALQAFGYLVVPPEGGGRVLPVLGFIACGAIAATFYVSSVRLTRISRSAAKTTDR